MRILITEHSGAGPQAARLIVGVQPVPVLGPSSQIIKSASFIQSWRAPDNVLNGVTPFLCDGVNSAQVQVILNVKPFGITEGTCTFDTGSLFCFDGKRNSNSDNVLMVLWDFPAHPTECAAGPGQLNSPPASGKVAPGDVRWLILRP
jgi:hypothetical protein